MWLSLLLIVGILFLLIAGVLSGGIFTLVLVPLAIVAALSAIGYWMWARGAGVDPAVKADPDAPLPRSSPEPTPSAPSTPDDLVDARQRQ